MRASGARTPPGPAGWPSCAHVPADPPPQLVPAANVTVSPGETAILSCRVLSEVPYNLTWIRDWRVLSSSTGRVTQLADLSLEVSGIIPSDSGRYQCMASNANGVTRASVWLLVRGEAPPVTSVLSIQHTTQHLPRKPIPPSLSPDVASRQQYQAFQCCLQRKDPGPSQP